MNRVFRGAMNVNWMFLPFKRYAEFSGRSRRKEYWMFFLFQMIVLFGFVGIAGLIDPKSMEPGAGPPGIVLALLGIYMLAVFVPSLAVQVRRFHDQNRSGWFVLINIIPYLGSLIVLLLMLVSGTQGENRFGPDPKGLPADGS
jgi:uncharacterized membrane protein YhaH (DUF805 family)